jgi:hypothetical protein
MTMARRLCSFAAILLFTAPAQAATLTDSPRAFLERLYSAYTPNGKGNDFAYPEARAIVDAPLLALLHQDQIRSKGEVGALDFDPVCQCQDWGPFKVLSMHAAMNGNDRAQGDVAFRPDPNSSENVHFDLVRENGAWKIHDLSWHGTPSLQAYLRNYKY